MHLGSLRAENGDRYHTLQLPVYLGEIPPESVCVELYADASNGEGPTRYEITSLWAP